MVLAFEPYPPLRYRQIRDWPALDAQIREIVDAMGTLQNREVVHINNNFEVITTVDPVTGGDVYTTVVNLQGQAPVNLLGSTYLRHSTADEFELTTLNTVHRYYLGQTRGVDQVGLLSEMGLGPGDTISASVEVHATDGQAGRVRLVFTHDPPELVDDPTDIVLGTENGTLVDKDTEGVGLREQLVAGGPSRFFKEFAVSELENVKIPNLATHVQFNVISDSTSTAGIITWRRAMLNTGVAALPYTAPSLRPDRETNMVGADTYLEFTGTAAGDKVTIPHNALWDIAASTAMTVEIEYITFVNTAFGQLIDAMSAGKGWRMAHTGTNDDFIFQAIHTDGLESLRFDREDMILFKRRHWAWTRDTSGVMKMYHDGRLSDDTYTNNNGATGTTAPLIGPDYIGGVYYVRIWGVTKTQAQLIDDRHTIFADNTATLNGDWRFNEGEGLIIKNHGLVADTDGVMSGTGIRFVGPNANSFNMSLLAAQTVTGVKTFEDGNFLMRNVADSFSSGFTNTNTAARTYTWPNLNGNVVLSGMAEHDLFSDFVADEHVAHSGVDIIAGVGLSGGGTIDATRTLTLDLNELGIETTIADGDFIAVVDITDSGSQKITFANFKTALALPDLSSPPPIGDVTPNTGDFTTLVATTHGGIAEANLLDKSNNETVSAGWLFASGLSVQGLINNFGQVGTFAFIDFNGAVSRFGSFNFDLAAWQPLQLKGTTTEIVGTTSITLTGTTNVDGALTATSYGGITEANLLDKSANENIDVDWLFKSGLSIQGGVSNIGQVGAFAFIDFNVTEAVFRFAAFDYGTSTFQPLQVKGTTTEIVGLTSITLTGPTSVVGTLIATSYGGITEANLLDKSATEVVTGAYTFKTASGIKIQDAGGTDHGIFSHDGTDFNAAFTNTTDWNITGAALLVGGIDVRRASSATVDGVVELATDAETVTGTDTARAITPANATAKMSAPGPIGDTTANTGAFTTLDAADNVTTAAAKKVLVGDTVSRTIGGAGPSLQVNGTTGSTPFAAIQRFSANALGPGLFIGKSRGTSQGVYDVVVDNDVIAILAGFAADGTDMRTEPARIQFEVDDAAPAASSIGGAIVFYTAPGVGADDVAEVGRFQADGTLLVADNHVMEGYATGRNVIRTIMLRLQPGATPGTNINATNVTGVNLGFNAPSITNGTNIAKSGTSGSFSLSASGQILTMDITETVVGILSAGIRIHNLNSSSTTEVYVVDAEVNSNNLDVSLLITGSSGFSDLTTILDAGDLCDIRICFVTST